MSERNTVTSHGNTTRDAATLDAATLNELLETVRAFRISEIDSFVADWEATRSMAPAATYVAAGAAGVLSVGVPSEHGGLGHSFEGKRRVFDIIAETAMSSAFSMINTQNIAEVIAQHGTPQQIERWVPGLIAGSTIGCTAITEPAVGSDVTAMTTRAMQDGAGWRIDGAKAWITNARIADLIVAYVQTEPGSGAAGIAGFLIDTSAPGVECETVEAMVGGHGIGAGTFTFDGYRAEATDIIAPPGEGFGLLLHGINGARTYVASMCCAMVRRSLAEAVAYATGRQAFGSATIDFQGLRWTLADVANQLEATSALVSAASHAIVSGAPRDAVLPAAHAKKFATAMAEPSIAACMQAMGAAGLRDEYPLGRHLAAARIASFTDGSTEMMTERIGRSLPDDYVVV